MEKLVPIATPASDEFPNRDVAPKTTNTKRNVSKDSVSSANPCDTPGWHTFVARYDTLSVKPMPSVIPPKANGPPLKYPPADMSQRRSAPPAAAPASCATMYPQRSANLKFLSVRNTPSDTAVFT